MSTFSANVNGRRSRSRAIATRSGKRAYAASTSAAGVVGPTGSDMFQDSYVQRELDLQGGAIRGIAVLRIQDGCAIGVARDAARDQQRAPGFGVERTRGRTVGDFGTDRLVHGAECDAAQRQ